MTDILHRHQLNELHSREENQYQRSKRSHKKINAQRQIKTPHAQSIKHNSHNKHLYIHHRIFKRVLLDPPSRNFIASPSQAPQTYSREDLKTIANQQPRNAYAPPQPARSQPVNQFRNYTIHESNINSQPCFDDAMIRFLLDMQNRDV